MRRIIFCFLYALFAGITVLFAQPAGIDALQKKQAAIQQEIVTLRKTLQDTRNSKKASLNELAIVKRKLWLREQAINTIQQQVDVIRGVVNKSANEITRLTSELDTLKAQYEKSVVYAYKSHSNYDFLNFVFSASNFADVLKRIEYLKSYRSYRRNQAATIQKTSLLLHQKMSTLQRERQQQAEILKLQQKERLVFAEEKKAKDEVINKLKAREKELVKELAAKAKADKKLNDGINAAIRREKEKERLVIVKKEKNSPVKKNEAFKREKNPRPDEPAVVVTAMSADFENNRSKMPWPVEEGVVTMHFGLQKIAGVIHNNPGLTIETEKNAPVKAVFDGVVLAVFDVDGTTAVFVKHGNYYTTYGGLSVASVSIGQAVKVGQMVGRAATNEAGNGEIEFVILKDNKKVDPALWIRKR